MSSVKSKSRRYDNQTSSSSSDNETSSSGSGDDSDTNSIEWDGKSRMSYCFICARLELKASGLFSGPCVHYEYELMRSPAYLKMYIELLSKNSKTLHDNEKKLLNRLEVALEKTTHTQTNKQLKKDSAIIRWNRKQIQKFKDDPNRMKWFSHDDSDADESSGSDSDSESGPRMKKSKSRNKKRNERKKKNKKPKKHSLPEIRRELLDTTSDERIPIYSLGRDFNNKKEAEEKYAFALSLGSPSFFIYDSPKSLSNVPLPKSIKLADIFSDANQKYSINRVNSIPFPGRVKSESGDGDLTWGPNANVIKANAFKERTIDVEFSLNSTALTHFQLGEINSTLFPTGDRRNTLYLPMGCNASGYAHSSDEPDYLALNKQHAFNGVITHVEFETIENYTNIPFDLTIGGLNPLTTSFHDLFTPFANSNPSALDSCGNPIRGVRCQARSVTSSSDAYKLGRDSVFWNPEARHLSYLNLKLMIDMCESEEHSTSKIYSHDINKDEKTGEFTTSIKRLEYDTFEKVVFVPLRSVDENAFVPQDGDYIAWFACKYKEQIRAECDAQKLADIFVPAVYPHDGMQYLQVSQSALISVLTRYLEIYDPSKFACNTRSFAVGIKPVNSWWDAQANLSKDPISFRVKAKITYVPIVNQFKIPDTAKSAIIQYENIMDATRQSLLSNNLAETVLGVTLSKKIISDAVSGELKRRNATVEANSAMNHPASFSTIARSKSDISTLRPAKQSAPIRGDSPSEKFLQAMQLDGKGARLNSSSTKNNKCNDEC